MDKDKELDLSIYNVRTDLAIEAHEMLLEKEQEEAAGPIKGVKIEDEQDQGIRVTRIEVMDKEGEQAIGKKIGRYISIEVPGLRKKDSEIQNRVATKFAQEFHRFLETLGISDNAKGLVIGLGNWNVTPDALGPRVIENLTVTRHLFQLMPASVEDGYREISAVSPGVLGITGIETSEIVQGIVDKSKPDFIIAVDALASRSLERVNTTIQISDTGINPGSGIGNKRKAIDRETLGVPVIAVGCPTVVDAVSVANDAIEYVLSHLTNTIKSNTDNVVNPLAPHQVKVHPYTHYDDRSRNMDEHLLGVVGSLDVDEKRQLIKEVLNPLGHDLIVTPKEVDTFIEDMANIIANGLNAALHKAIDKNNVSAYTH